jgi:hypothetical protein
MPLTRQHTHPRATLTGISLQMDALKLINEWNRDLATLAISALGTDEFFPALVEAVRSRVPIAYPQFWLYHSSLPPRVLYHEIPAPAVASQIDDYLEGPYREDPFFQTSMDRPKSRIYLLSRVTAGRLEESSYYNDYYSSTGTVDEAVYLSLRSSRQRDQPVHDAPAETGQIQRRGVPAAVLARRAGFEPAAQAQRIR